MQEISVPMHCPSFSSYSSIRFAEIATKVTEEFSYERDEFGLQPKVVEEDNTKEEADKKQSSNNNNDDDDEEEFEFAFVSSRDPSNTSLSISADEIFSNGRIKPIFPIFDRDLLLNDKKVQEINSKPPTKSSSRRLPLGRLFSEERDSSSSSSSSEGEDQESVRSGTYCIWSSKSIPSSPDTSFNKKSYSSGNKSKRFRLKDLIRRSNSDVNETYVFLAPPLMAAGSSSKTKKSHNEKFGKVGISMDQRKNSSETNKDIVKMKPKKVIGGESVVSSHEIHYLRNRALKEGARRRSYLPYKMDLIGFFTNVNGLNRKLYPFQTA
ncbi:Protein of unknown function DUF1645 [Macleaya cordata]|uniref:DUF1645 domain-containing protein n=1 Tax=Macleaya cordata TaxID=56857 RepID=A0A200QAU1_MACCD|nr:Protein of unknown function DUF1645 [Macleaya cordata]